MTVPAPEIDAPPCTESLADHLAAMEIRPYDTFGRGGPNLPGLDRSTREKVHRRRVAIGRGATARRQKSLFAFATTPTLVAYLHSIKADAIRASGEAVAPWLSDLPAGARILDAGCNVGYLTLWYARRFPRLEVVGCDFVPEAVAYATASAAERGIANVRFEVADLTVGVPDGEFDAVVSTQVVTAIEDDRAPILARVAAALRPGGTYVSVEILGTPGESAAFIDEAAAVGLAIVGASMAAYCDDGRHGAYPVLAFRKGGDPVVIDLHAMYVAWSARCRRLQLRDMAWTDEEIEQELAMQDAPGGCAGCG